MLNSTISCRRTMQVVLALCLAMFASASLAAQFLYTGGHELDDERIAALGHSYVTFNADDGGWATALAGGYGPFTAIVVGEDSGDTPLSLATSQAIASYVAGGGRVVVISDHDGNAEFLNAVFGYSAMVRYGCYDDDSTAATRQSAVTGTSFANGPSTVGNLSCTSAFTSSSIPSLTKKFYQGSDEGTITTLAFGSSYSNGSLVWLGYDYCCGGSQAQVDAWYMVLDSALNFVGGSCSGYIGPKLTLCTRTCAATSTTRAGLIRLFTAIYGSAPSCAVPPARAPQAVFGNMEN